MGKDTDMSTPGVLADCMKIIEDIRLYNVEGSYIWRGTFCAEMHRMTHPGITQLLEKFSCTGLTSSR